MHHLCFEVDDILAARDSLKAPAPACSATASRRSARTASRCCSCIPRISSATLIELEQVRRVRRRAASAGGLSGRTTDAAMGCFRRCHGTGRLPALLTRGSQADAENQLRGLPIPA